MDSCELVWIDPHITPEIAAREQGKLLKSSPRVVASCKSSSTGRPNIFCLVVACSLALAMTVQTSALFGADDIQQIKLGTHTLYVQKTWMTEGRVTAYLPQGMVQKPQPTVIETDSISFLPNENWRPYSNRELPYYINLIDMPWSRPVQTSGPLQTGDIQLQRWMADAARSTPDQDGFVRVEAYGVFLYKPSLNSPLGPVVVQSTDQHLMPWHNMAAFVHFVTSNGIGVQYRFDNTKFPESTWWDLYQHVLAFIENLQTPK
jgi:hypothetical protein